MADLQEYFQQFHDAIALRRDAEKATLAQKRQIVLDKLAAGIKEQKEGGAEIPPYKPLNQGSYPMGTGIKPVKGDYDLDVALRFDLAKDDFDPLTVKTWVLRALDGHTKEVRLREPCVTVFYTQGGEPVYHLDFAIYSASNDDDKSYLARGKTGSLPENKRWEESDPEALINALKTKFDDSEDRAQMRRVIRGQKRWKDERFPVDGNAAPTGIALTACALAWFSVSKTEDRIANTTKYNDHQAMLELVREMLKRFTVVWDSTLATLVQRLEVTLPVPPSNDLFAKMTSGQMATFKERLEALRDALQAAKDDVDPHTAAKGLRKVFGDDFPVPDKEEVAKTVGPAIVGSGNSA